MNDINIAKNNISRMMKQKNITQAKLGELLGINQPCVSNALDTRQSRFFTVEQIIKLAEIFECSTDKILLSPQNQCHNDIKTLSDAMEMLFILDSFIDFTIENFEVADDDNIIHKATFMRSDSSYLQKILKQWGELKKSSLSSDFKKEVIQDWKKRILKEHSTITKEEFLNQKREWIEDFLYKPL